MLWPYTNWYEKCYKSFGYGCEGFTQWLTIRRVTRVTYIVFESHIIKH